MINSNKITKRIINYCLSLNCSISRYPTFFSRQRIFCHLTCTSGKSTLAISRGYKFIYKIKLFNIMVLQVQVFFSFTCTKVQCYSGVNLANKHVVLVSNLFLYGVTVRPSSASSIDSIPVSIVMQKVTYNGFQYKQVK